MNGLGLKGGQAGTYNPIDPRFTSMTRQRRRQELRENEYKIVQAEFALPRRIARAIARTRANKKFMPHRAKA